ncbi:uncharacterized protein GGS22DRAFT_199230 [Annulohypoxylon maeteangense]|uniref:uncharacterized protein n=1 Tax=Annulohypoxylon maeteangense TaxID=1927788 RepID=UPI002007F044|nr:uncharacterized protein GGS22DRAFT_199230 [Annulohypoxylon maeteangense]KAI0886908.1 hypothetical protein GGS22DRAFT_199230 [Annulohypoxylon maeteangense]
MSSQDKRINLNPVPTKMPSLPRYDSGVEATFQERRNRTMPLRPDAKRYYSESSSAEASTRPSTQLSRSATSQRSPYVPYRPGAVWRAEEVQGTVSTSMLSQPDRFPNEGQAQPPLTADNVRWPFLGDDDDEESDEPNEEFPAVPLSDAPLRRRGAIRVRELTNTGISGRLPLSPTDDQYDILSPLGEIRRDPFGASQRRAQQDREMDRGNGPDSEQSWTAGDDNILTAKNVPKPGR